jgi:zinc protease
VFLRTYYTPNNLSIALTGNFDPADAKQLVDRYYGAVPRGPALAAPKTCVPALLKSEIVNIVDHAPRERLYLAWPSPPYFGPGDAELDLVSYILTDGLSSRLHEDLVYTRQLCCDVVSFQKSMEIAGLFGIWATLRPHTSCSEVEASVKEYISQLGRAGPSMEELDRAKAKCKLRYIRRVQRLGGFGGKADLLNTYNTYLGSADKFALDIDRHLAATTEGVRHAVSDWIDTSNQVQLRFYPKSKR